MRLLDLFCGAGGAAEGYRRAGFDVVGIDIAPQPHYPFKFLEMDVFKAMPILEKNGYLRHVDLIHASPPCQLFTVYNNVKSVRESTSKRYQNLIPSARELLIASQRPYVIENVYGARSELKNPIRLCGTSFNTRVRRHRLFETGGWSVTSPPPCDHKRFTDRVFPGSTNRPNGRTVCNIGEYRVPLKIQKECMQVSWDVTLHELSEMVPPVFTEFIGRQFIEAIKRTS